jgi:hypothetical protein
MTSTAVPSTPAAPQTAVAAAVAADAWLRRFRAVVIGILGAAVGGIGALAFYTSFEAIKQYAHRSGGIDPHHDFAIPLLVDSFIVVATGADLWFTTTDRRRRLWELWWPKALLAGAAGVSFTLNVAHVKGNDWAARGVAAIPPAALILGVELLMQVLRRATLLRTERLASSPTSVGESPPPKVEVSQEDSPGAPGLPTPPKPGPSRPRRSRGDKRPGPAPVSQRAREFVLSEWAEGRRPTGGEIDRRFQVSEGYGRRLLRDLAAPTNGQPAPASSEGGQS